MRPNPIPTREWIKARVREERGCWIWTEKRSPGGYGRVSYGCKSHEAHRVAYELFVGPIPHGLHVMHSCDVPACVNPDHLSVGTAKQNKQDSLAKGRYWHPHWGKAHCKNGHAFTPENTRVLANRRVCRACDRARSPRNRSGKWVVARHAT